MLKRRDFYHQRICYSFNWNLKHHKDILQQVNGNQRDVKLLGKFFKRVYKGEIPEHLFNSREIQRVSRFKILGLKKAFVNSYTKKLIREGKIEIYDNYSIFPQYVQKVYLSFQKNKIYKTPGHEPVLKNILIKDSRSIAIEVPIWKKVRDSYITGHIDLIQFDKDGIKIIDYKPEGNFLISLPQVATYGLLIKDNFSLQDVKCISFNKKEAWEYEPEILLSEIGKYLENHRINRPWEKFLPINKK